MATAPKKRRTTAKRAPAAKKRGMKNPFSNITTKEMKVTGENLLKTVKKLVHEGTVRRIVIKQKGRTLMEIPMGVGAIAVFIAPVLAAVGAVAALVTDCTILVERESGK